MYVKISTLLLLIPIFSYSQTNDIMAEKSFYIINTQKDIGLNYWNIVNDDVMGGISKSYLSLNDEKNLVFKIKNWFWHFLGFLWIYLYCFLAILN